MAEIAAMGSKTVPMGNVEGKLLIIMVKIIGINNVTILTSNKVKAKEFYTKTLGFEKIEKRKHLWIKIGSQYIHITENSGKSVSNTFYHFAIEVENLRDYLKEIMNKNVEVFDLDENQNMILVNTSLDQKKRNYFVEDLDGNLIEFIDSDNMFFK